MNMFEPVNSLDFQDIQAIEKPGFIVDHIDDYGIEVEDESNDDDHDLFDSLRREMPKAMPIFFCKNCEYKQHQCFACGKLGSSDKSSVAEVFRCVSAACGQFYHPHCIAQLIYQDNRVTAEELEKKISMGESFTCPIHKCCVCKQGENKKDPELREIVIEKIEKTEEEEEEEDEEVENKEDEDIEGEDVITRGWDGLLPNRVLIYCLKHEIVKRIKTPIRDHLKFPDVNEKKTGLEEKKKKRAAESVLDREKSVTKKRNLPSEEFYRGKTAHTISKQKLKSPCAVKVGASRTTEKVPFGLDISRRVKVNSSLKKEIKTSVAEERKSSFGDMLFGVKGSEQVKSGKQGKPDGERNSAVVNLASKKLSSAPPSLDVATKRRLLALMKDAVSSITLEEVKRKHKLPSTYALSSRNAVERNITLGKVEGSIEAVRTALQKLEEGCSTEDLELLACFLYKPSPNEPKKFKHLSCIKLIDNLTWVQNKLRVYLAPFLHGMRYTSSGRHFTKIADRLHWYVKNGDMIVDFCCGANDFSIIMKKKLEETGKKCFYKNYDFIQPKSTIIIGSTHIVLSYITYRLFQLWIGPKGSPPSLPLAFLLNKRQPIHTSIHPSIHFPSPSIHSPQIVEQYRRIMCWDVPTAHMQVQKILSFHCECLLKQPTAHMQVQKILSFHCECLLKQHICKYKKSCPSTVNAYHISDFGFMRLMKQKNWETDQRLDDCSTRGVTDGVTIGRKLEPVIMGLNPPFGVKAALANKFIDKALEFNPRILILIVPPETQR
ncbi:ENHANCED DOWNY MILDEW 2 [Prunus dulcis]|uniref:ENHANCED DOWNY MILDEW 2 n=1 Tax=Prunus dulcis TaxID=3755 RepID=A0A4Y1RD45_PRUDU|nr:ENHANCED DOWNY MILDEW 2 [Prunus dulcis]